MNWIKEVLGEIPCGNGSYDEEMVLIYNECLEIYCEDGNKMKNKLL